MSKENLDSNEHATIPPNTDTSNEINDLNDNSTEQPESIPSEQVSLEIDKGKHPQKDNDTTEYSDGRTAGNGSTKANHESKPHKNNDNSLERKNDDLVSLQFNDSTKSIKSDYPDGFRSKYPEIVTTIVTEINAMGISPKAYGSGVPKNGYFVAKEIRFTLPFGAHQDVKVYILSDKNDYVKEIIVFLANNLEKSFSNLVDPIDFLKEIILNRHG